MHHPLKPTVSVVIPVYNGGSSFRRCLSSLATVPSPLEIIVVADGDTDGSGEVAQEWGAKVIKLPASGGPAKARNIGARQAQGDIIFFIDADVAIAPGVIEQVATVFQANPELSALVGSYDDAPGELNFLSQYKNLFHHYTHQTACEEASTFWGACGAIRRELFLEMGGFDERYRRPCVEDIELGYRLKAAGHSILLCKELQVKHLKRWEPLNLLRAEFFYRALPWTALILRDRQMVNDLNLQLTSRVSVVLTYALLLALMFAWWWSSLLAIAVVLLLVLMFINAPVYRFFLHKRGLLFTLQTIPWHLFYFLYGGLAFAIGLIRHWFGNRLSGKLSFAD